MERRIMVSLFAVLVLAACAEKEISYSRSSTLPPGEVAKAIIKQVIQEQPPKRAPFDTEVTDEYFRMITYRTEKHILTGSVSTPIAKVVYFNSIAEIKLSREGKWYVISFRDESKGTELHIYAIEENKAKSFIDGLYAMQKNKTH